MKLFLFIVLIGISSHAYADQTAGNIIQVSRKLRMSHLEPLPPKEFYIDLGARDGVKAGDILEVFRMLPVVNSMSGGAWHLMKVTLGDIKVTLVGDSTSIGRIATEREPASLPSIEYQGFMVGDQVETRSQLPSH